MLYKDVSAHYFNKPQFANNYSRFIEWTASIISMLRSFYERSLISSFFPLILLNPTRSIAYHIAGLRRNLSPQFSLHSMMSSLESLPWTGN